MRVFAPVQIDFCVRVLKLASFFHTLIIARHAIRFVARNEANELNSLFLCSHFFSHAVLSQPLSSAIGILCCVDTQEKQIDTLSHSYKKIME